MEWAVPLQKIDVNKINVGQIRYGEKPLAPLAYLDGPIHLPSVNILLPPLLVKDYDPQTGRLKLSIQDNTSVLHTLSSLQETLLKIVFQKQSEWFPGSRKTSEELHVFFQPFVENNIINLYCPSAVTGNISIPIWKDRVWSKGVTVGSIVKGDTIRVGLRIQGISFQHNLEADIWTGRFRLQHKILQVFCCPKITMSA
jgi:hypothetical protein